VPVALYCPAGEVRGVGYGVGLPEGVSVEDGVGVEVEVGLTAMGVFWLSITIATASTTIIAITPTTASILFRLRALTAEGLTLRFGRELMPTSITKILFKDISNLSKLKEKGKKVETKLSEPIC